MSARVGVSIGCSSKETANKSLFPIAVSVMPRVTEDEGGLIRTFPNRFWGKVSGLEHHGLVVELSFMSNRESSLSVV
ncbi:hypothetical protein GCM10023116_28760 [Kistimonas scapharcae]|uniref:Uncharacterized protein n=1 Tax=Kistimonas scapharcae TaxID=1036133 RepID=A0ABP8V2Y7_9GAMM